MHDCIRVTNIQRLCVNDGPGVRTTVFLKGCYLSCPWCCNPETIYFDEDLYYVKNQGKCGTYDICLKCEKYGGSKSLIDCPLHVYSLTYKDYNTDDLYEILKKDYKLFELGGGVTFSGGEPLFQSHAILKLIRKLSNDGVHITLETSLYASTESLELLFKYIDYWIIDVKFQFGFIKNIKSDQYSEQFAKNIRYLQLYHPDRLAYRMVISHQAIPNTPTIIKRLLHYGVRSIELLECHTLAYNKYIELGKNISQFTKPNDEELAYFERELKINGIQTSVLKI